VTPTWTSREIVQEDEKVSEQDIIVLTQDQNGKHDIGVATNGGTMPLLRTNFSKSSKFVKLESNIFAYIFMSCLENK
jgi:hypothetical protein